MKIDFILCTKDRPDAIKTLLNSINTLDQLELAEVTVVDSSKKPLELDSLQFTKPMPVKVIQSKPGLPTQRNIGLKSSKNPIVVFLDDDVVLAENFISATIEEFSQNIDIAGIGYLLKGVEFSDKKLFRNFAVAVNEEKFGQVTKTGINYWYPERGERLSYKPPMWLPGCAMAFRRTEINGVEFNPVLEEGILGGYALGEDVDFTLRLQKKGKKFRLCVKTTVDHYEAPGERDNSLQLSQAQGNWLKFLTKTHKQYVRTNRVFLRLFAEFLYLKLAFFINRGSSGARICSRERLLNFLQRSPYSEFN
jgi:GT2 family glycosyltransferase